MFQHQGAGPDPQAVVSKVWEIYLDGESKKTQLYADAHVKCKSVKERFFNLERRFACYRNYLRELPSPELDEAGEESQLREDAKWFREQTEDEFFRTDSRSTEKSASDRRADADKFWNFFECAMNDVAYKDEPVPESSYESTGNGLFTLQSPSKLECSDRLRDAFKDGPFKKQWDTAAGKNASAAQTKAAATTAIPGLGAPPLFGGGAAFGGGGFGAVLGASQNIENPVADLWPYYKLWFEYHWKKRIKQDVKVKNSVVLRDKNEISGRGYFTKVLVVSQEDGQPAKAHKHEEGWPKFKTHYSARVEKGQHKKLLDRMDIVPATKFAAHDGPKQASMPVNGVDDVVCSISLLSEQLHECLRMRPDDVPGESLDIKSLKGIESFMYPL